MKAINYTDIKRVYSNSVITLELVDGTTYKAYEFEFMNDEDEGKGKSILELLKVNTLDGDFKTDKIDAEKIRCHGVDEEENTKEDIDE